MVALNLVVSSEGVPHDITVSKTLSLDFDNAAIEACKAVEIFPRDKSLWNARSLGVVERFCLYGMVNLLAFF